MPRPVHRRSLYDLSRVEIESMLTEMGEPSYRMDQLWHWIYRRHAPSVDAMTSLPLGLRRRLGAQVDLGTLDLAERARSRDLLAEKYVFRLVDGHLIETVLMHYVDGGDPVRSGTRQLAPATGRSTVCVSTQVGCAMGCEFCATGQAGLVRNLTAGECLEQIAWCARELALSGRRLSNVVFMGMGEPLANWPATWGAVRTLVDGDGFALSPRRLTISTVGVVPGIHRLARADLPVRLAVSLHAPDDDLRGRLVAVNSVYGLSEIMAACREYQSRRGRRITIEYVLIRAVNDRPEQARALAKRLRGLSAHVNLIPLNPTPGSALRPSSRGAAAAFEAILADEGVPASTRARRGLDIRAGCGQLQGRLAGSRDGRSLAAAKR